MGIERAGIWFVDILMVDCNPEATLTYGLGLFTRELRNEVMVVVVVVVEGEMMVGKRGYISFPFNPPWDW